MSMKCQQCQKDAMSSRQVNSVNGSNVFLVSLSLTFSHSTICLSFHPSFIASPKSFFIFEFSHNYSKFTLTLSKGIISLPPFLTIFPNGHFFRQVKLLYTGIVFLDFSIWVLPLVGGVACVLLLAFTGVVCKCSLCV